MLIARDTAQLAAMRREILARSRGLGLAPTMGALHDGHISLIRAGQADGLAMAASIFVNPLQFAPGEDLTRYPRDEANDLARLEAAGCDLVWLPSVVTMYPPGHATTITMAGPAVGFEGAARPGHFSGVATVVAALLGQVRPSHAYFGEKDWQQLQVVRRLAADLPLDCDICGVPIMREADGLAMSSRNRFLTEAERALAPALYQALQTVAEALRRGIPLGLAVGESQARLRALGFTVDYLALVDGPTLTRITRAVPGARLLAAAKLGSVRLLDNVAVA
jgi:pantoate--beta-alanine ligase